MTSTTRAARPPGRPRSERAERGIIEAVLDLLAEGTSVSALSIEAVASRAGVGKATIYRRWPNKDALLIDALAMLQEPMPDLPGTSVRDDLVALVDRIRREAVGSRAAQILPCLAGEARKHPELMRRYHKTVIEPRREVVREVLRRGMATGELRPDLDVELALMLISGPMLALTKLVSPDESPPKDLSARMVDAVLEGLAAR